MAKLKIKQMEGIIEAILFTMGDSVEIGKIARAPVSYTHLDVYKRQPLYKKLFSRNRDTP